MNYTLLLCLIEERCAITFPSDQINDLHLEDDKRIKITSRQDHKWILLGQVILICDGIHLATR